MGKYIKKPVLIEAFQWFKNGDHPLDESVPIQPVEGDKEVLLTEGKLVRYYQCTADFSDVVCHRCSTSSQASTYSSHGWIDTLEGGHIVCPGDYIIKGIAGEFYPCKPNIFDQTYTIVDARTKGEEIIRYTKHF